MKHLVVTADDFGAAREVNDAVEHAHRNGILTAASLMIAAPAAADAVNRARAMPSLRVGLHIVLVEGRPISPRPAIPDLVDESGRFRADMARTGVAIFFRPDVRRQMEDEIEAQFEAFRTTGLKLDHVNTHKHFHLHPTISRAILRIGKRHGMTALRIPLERGDILQRAEPGHRTGRTALTALFASMVKRQSRKNGIRVPEAVFGLAWSGAMRAPRLRGIIENLPDGLSEIYLHPATGGGFEGAADGYAYAEELSALTDPAVMAAARNPEIKLGGFSDFLRRL